MKKSLTFAIAVIIFFATNTVSAKAPNWVSITTTKMDSVHSKTEYKSIQKVDGKNVVIRLTVYTNSEIANTMFAYTENEDCTGYAPVQTTIAKNFTRMEIAKTDNGLSVIYEDKIFEKNVPIELAMAQK